MNALADLFQQPVFYRAGWVLVHFLWQGAGTGLLLAVALRLLNKASSHLRYLVICGALLACGIAPVVTWAVLARHAAPPPRVLQEPAGYFAADAVIPTPMLPPIASAPVTQDSSVAAPMVAASKPSALSWHTRGLQKLDPLLPYLVCLWMAGVLVLTMRLALGWMQLRRVRRSGVAISDPVWEKRFRDLAGRMRVSAPVRLLKSALVEVPTLIGWLRPVILLPASVFTGLNAGQLEAILAHELAHVRRYDYLVNLFQTAIETILFYHPAVWWISRKLREERENCCDDIAVETMRDRAIYASALAALEEGRAFPPPLAMAASGGTLLGRIRRIAGVECGKSSLAPVVAAALIIGCLLAPMGGRLASGQDSSPMPKTTGTPGSASKENPFVNSLGMKFVPVPGTKVLFSIWDTRMKDYRVYAEANPRVDASWDNSGNYEGSEDPGFKQRYDLHPVVQMSWNDAKAFCAWLTQKERKEGKIGQDQEYRLPTDKEWSAAVGAGKYPWGNDWPPPKGAGNYNSSLKVDDFANTSPVGSFRANQYGLYDMGGNVWQWCEDWYRSEMNDKALQEKYPFLKDDGGGKKYRVRRGAGCYDLEPGILLSSCRCYDLPGTRQDNDFSHGFRCVLTSGIRAGENTPAVNQSEAEKLIAVAVHKGDVAALQKLLGPGVDPNKTLHKGMPVLFFAGSPEVAEILIKHGADPNIKDKEGYPALAGLCISKDKNAAATVRVLLKAGADPNVRYGEMNETPAMEAASAGILDALAEYGADLYAKTSGGLSVLMMNGRECRLEVFQAILKHGVPFDPKTDGASILVSVAWINGLGMAQWLLDHGVDPNTPRNGVMDINRHHDLQLPIESAAVSGNPEMITLLLNHGAKGDKPMVFALHNNHAAVVKVFWDHGVRAISELAYAVSQGAKVEELQKILAKGSAVDPPQDTIITPLGAAAGLGRMDLVKFLVEHGADVNKGSATNPEYPQFVQTPLARAASEGRDEIVEYLLKHGAKPDFSAMDGAVYNSAPYPFQRSPEHFAQTIKMLIDAGALKGATPGQAGNYLSAAIWPRSSRPGSEAVLKMLLAAGLSPESPKPGLDQEHPNSVIEYLREAYEKDKESKSSYEVEQAATLKPLLDLLEKADAGKTPKQGDVTGLGNDSITDSQNTDAEKLIADAVKKGEVPADFPAAVEWYDTLGFPDVKDLPYVRVSMGDSWVDHGKPAGPVFYQEGFLVSEDASSFTVFICSVPDFDNPYDKFGNHGYPALTTVRFVRKDTGPEYSRVNYEVVDFKTAAAGILDKMRAQASKNPPFGGWPGGPPLHNRARIFALGRACLQKGAADTGLALMTIAANIRKIRQIDEVKPAANLRDLLQQDLGDAVIFEAEEQFGDTSKSWGDLLKNYENFDTRFPACDKVAYSKESAALLRTMIAEKAAHHPKPPEQMSLAERVAEAIYQLRNLKDEGTPAHKQPPTPVDRLISSGFDAVPQLIAALDDRRFTRSLPIISNGFEPSYDLRVGEFAESILESISGRNFYAEKGDGGKLVRGTTRQQIEAWWSDVNKKGEKSASIETGSAGGETDVTLPHEAAAPAAPQGAVKADLTNALVAAARMGDAAAAERLLEEGADPNGYARFWYENALLSAAMANHSDVVAVLLKHGANPNSEQSGKMSTCQFMVMQGRTDIARVLHDAGGKISPAAWAGMNGDIPALKTLANAGTFKKGTDEAMEPAIAAGQLDAVKYLETLGGKAKAVYLARAAGAGRIGMMQYLFSEGGIDADAQNMALSEAVRYDQPEALKLLLARGARPYRPRMDSMIIMGNIFCTANSSAVVKLLLDAGINPNLDAEPGMALSFAPDAESVRLLVQHGADPKAKRSDGVSAIESAVQIDRPPEVIDALIDAGVEFDPKGNGTSALCLAAGRNDVELIDDLLRHGVDPNNFRAVNIPHGGFTAIGLATRNNSADAVRLLLARGANAAGDPREERSPLAWAVKNGRPDIADMLREAGAR